MSSGGYTGRRIRVAIGAVMQALDRRRLTKRAIDVLMKDLGCNRARAVAVLELEARNTGVSRHQVAALIITGPQQL